ncbi:MAG: hypothetical protein JOZ46_05875 [Candidatus Dormibacteraeota bacterium]|nr:hypothetical protein [Candidatus Dormibacteraeota bacterium]MBV9525327.1 hypothetical protein [Candidatus Dormibacteraeota bacterium]
MNAILFDMLAALVVAAAAGTVVQPRLRRAALALAGLALAVTVLFLSAGAYAVGIVEAVVALLTGAIAWGLLVRGRVYRGVLEVPPAAPRTRWVGGAVAGLLTLLLLVVFALSATDWHSGGAGAALVTVLHYRAVYALLLAIALVAVGAGVALLVGRTSDDEREADRAYESRLRREERERRRREDREAARRARGRREGQEA